MMKKHGFQVQIKSDESKGSFTGLANKRWFKDHAKDVTTDTAFTKSIEEHKAKGTLPKLLLQHDHKQVVGVFVDMWEDEQGLWVKGQICLDTELGRETYALMKMGALTDLSIGYIVNEEKYDHTSKTNFLMDVSVKEVSIVTFPCNSESNIVDVKSDIDNIEYQEEEPTEAPETLSEETSPETDTIPQEQEEKLTTEDLDRLKMATIMLRLQKLSLQLNLIRKL